MTQKQTGPRSGPVHQEGTYNGGAKPVSPILDPDEQRRQALERAIRGWRVVPRKAGAKYPALKDWQNKATTDPATIQKWNWSHGVCIVTGAESDLIVLDVDGELGEVTLGAR
jgi:hypothetical protein